MAGYFSEIFGDSPVIPIQEHGEVCYKAAGELVAFFASVADENWDEAVRHRTTIVSLENEADDLKRGIRSQITTGMMMPVSREDLLDLVLLQDKIANTARHISGLVIGRKLHIPSTIKEKMLLFVDRNIDAAKVARTTIRELDELYEAGFKGKEASLVATLVDHLDAIENDTDDMQVDLRTSLWHIEDEIPPIDVMFLYRVIEKIGDVADRAEALGRRLEVLINR